MLKVFARLLKPRKTARYGLSRLGSFTDEQAAQPVVRSNQSVNLSGYSHDSDLLNRAPLATGGTKESLKKNGQRFNRDDLTESFGSSRTPDLRASKEDPLNDSEGWPAEELVASDHSASRAKRVVSRPSAAIGDVHDLSNQVRRLSREVHASNQRQSLLLARMEELAAASMAAPNVASAGEGIDAQLAASLLKLPEALRAVAPQATDMHQALAQIESLTNGMKSQMLLQKQSFEDLRGLRGDLATMIGSIQGVVRELGGLHQAALAECHQLAEENRVALRSQRAHIVELRRQQHSQFAELERENDHRMREHEKRTHLTVKRVKLVTGLMVLVIGGGILSFGRFVTAFIDNNRLSAPQHQATDDAPTLADDTSHVAADDTSDDSRS